MNRSQILPEAFLRCLSKEDRKSLGKAGMTAEEALCRMQIKNERALQVAIVNLLRLKGIEPLWHRTDKKSAATVGWCDLTFAVSGPAPSMEVPLGKNGKRGVAVVSAEDFELVSQFKWTRVTSSGNRYAISTIAPRIFMHRLVMSRVPNPEDKLDIDHVNRNGLDNSRHNLRWATRSENCMNRNGNGATSGFKGVSWSEQRQKWVAYIKINKKSCGLGRFESEIEAAKAYDRAAVEAYGEFAFQNFPIFPIIAANSGKTVYPCAWEIKYGNGQLSLEQQQMHVRLSTPPNCWRIKIIRSVDDAITELTALCRSVSAECGGGDDSTDLPAKSEREFIAPEPPQD